MEPENGANGMFNSSNEQSGSGESNPGIVELFMGQH